MPRIEPLSISDLAPAERSAVEKAEGMMGFVANDALTMARNPELMHAFAKLVGAIYKPSRIDNGLKRLIGLITSSAAGCEYCMGHTAFTSEKFGVATHKIEQVWQFETSDGFTDAERVALRVALHGGQSPSGVTDEMFQELAQHFDVDQQLEIVSVIALFGFLNRWNATLATELEGLPGAALAKLRS
ncbi:MAG: carboxymuconolactone decarboxylase family protein [Pseudomonadota bacterium]